MRPSRKSATSTATERARQAVYEEAREAIAARWESSADAFVWRARRCAEAVLYATLQREGVDVGELAAQRKGLDGLLGRKELEATLSRETRAQLSSLREFGNIAAHYQLGGGVSAESAEAMARLLAGLLREFYEADGEAVPEAMARPLRSLIDPSLRERTRLEVERDEARRERDQLRLQLAATQREQGTTASDRPASARGRALPLVAGLVVGVIVTWGAVELARTSDQAQRNAMGAVVLSTPPIQDASMAPTEIPRPVPHTTPDAAAMPAVVDASTAAPALSCPEGTIRGHDGCVSLGFVTTREYRSCVAAGRCERPSVGQGSNWQNREETLPINYVDAAQALSYCEWAYPDGGRLPSYQEWLDARRRARAQHLRFSVGGGTNEHVGEGVVEPRRFGRQLGARPSPQGGARDLGFRCARR